MTATTDTPELASRMVRQLAEAVAPSAHHRRCPQRSMQTAEFSCTCWVKANRLRVEAVLNGSSDYA